MWILLRPIRQARLDRILVDVGYDRVLIGERIDVPGAILGVPIPRVRWQVTFSLYKVGASVRNSSWTKAP